MDDAFLDAWLKKKIHLESWDAASLLAWQRDRAIEVAEFARERSPYYRRLLGDSCLKDFSALPFTDGGLLAENSSQMLCVSQSEIARIRTFPTSGTTGTPKRMYFSIEDQKQTAEFFFEGMSFIASAEKPTLIMMSNDRPGSIASLLQEGLRRRNKASVIYGRPKNPAETALAIKEAGCLVGFPSDIFYLCRKFPELSPDSVLLSADYIPSSLCKAIEEKWRCQVFCHYGLTETCYGLAVECPAHQGMHLRHADFLVEIIDAISGEVLPFGEEGEIVLTSLRKSPLPLIRYRTGDSAGLTAEKCGCGSALPRLSRVSGRLSNVKQPVNIHRLEDLLYGMGGVAGFEARMNGEVLHLRIDGENISKNRLEHALRCPICLDYGEAVPWRNDGKRFLYTLGS